MKIANVTVNTDRAKHVADHEAPGGAFQWTVLADPDGNEFCVTQGH